MRERIKIHRGLDLPLAGGLPADAPNKLTACMPRRVAVCPDDFPGFVPKPDVKEGDLVDAGSALLHDKTRPDLRLTSPCSGRVAAIVRGERRKIERVVIDVDFSDRSGDLSSTSSAEDDRPGGLSSTSSAEGDRSGDLSSTMLARSGLMALIRRRPYDIVATPDDRPRDIYVGGIDSAPLAFDPVEAVKLAFPENWLADLTEGVKLLKKLTTGDVYISCRPQTLPEIEGAVMLDVEGPHPAGLASTLMAATRPLNKGQEAWALSLQTLARIGEFARTGRVDGSAIVAITGSEALEPHLVKTLVGAELSGLLSGEMPKGEAAAHTRIISGNVLTGVREQPDGWLRYPYTQITLIPEGDNRDSFMGWASLSPKRHSVSRSFPSFFMRGKLFAPDARINGGRRAMILSGLWNKVMPLDIMPEPLIKAIIGNDIDRMEQLGIYEVAPEDFALAEYVDPSKTGLQNIVRHGINYMIANA